MGAGGGRQLATRYDQRPAVADTRSGAGVFDYRRVSGSCLDLIALIIRQAGVARAMRMYNRGNVLRPTCSAILLLTREWQH